MFEKLKGTIQIDVDEVWTLLRYFGHDSKDSNQVYLSSIPRMLDLFDLYNFKTTFFIVGKDAKHTAKRNILKQIVNRGHELANHSLSHVYGLAEQSFKKKKEEILEADKIISDIAGKKITGFRSPAYSVDEEILDILEENDYLYDSSLFPSFFCSLIRYFQKNEVAKSAYGKFYNGTAPLSLYHPLKGEIWKIGNRRLVEIPVSVIPYFRLPFHMAYVYASHTKLFDIGFFMLRNSGSIFNYVLHGTELIDRLDDQRFPSGFKVNTPVEIRLAIYKNIFSKISNYINIISSENLIAKSRIHSKKHTLNEQFEIAEK
tara:strand:+ start:306 stop:1253 length:948 start_codon:yes stop_codon:yes gene_type:complete